MARADDLFAELRDLIAPFVDEDEQAADLAKRIICQTDLLLDLADEFTP